MNARGFTLVEVLLAITLLAVGVLSLAATAALVTRLIAQGERSALAATFAAQRLERLRTSACARREEDSGIEHFRRGAVAMASSRWHLSHLGGRTWTIAVTTAFPGIQGWPRILRLEAAVTC